MVTTGKRPTGWLIRDCSGVDDRYGCEEVVSRLKACRRSTFDELVEQEQGPPQIAGRTAGPRRVLPKKIDR
jgi:hypothetical protein